MAFLGHVFCLFLFFVFFLLVLSERNQHAGARAVAIHRAALAPRAPCLHIELVDHLLADVVWQIDGDTDRVVNPLLHIALHFHLVHPVHVVGCGLVIG